MFNLIRRISYGVIPRPDRPWEDDATSNAPRPRRKRRMSSTERDNHDSEEEQARKKKARGESTSSDLLADGSRDTPLPQQEPETSEVKEVTKGVKLVDLDAGGFGALEVKIQDGENEAVEGVQVDVAEESKDVDPESVPLPEDESGELELEETGDSIASSSGSVDEATEGASDESETQGSTEIRGSVDALAGKKEIISDVSGSTKDTPSDSGPQQVRGKE